jgi:two-component system cell cycle response regulator DivK
MARLGFVDWIEKPAAPGRLFGALERAIGPTDTIFRVLVVERDRAATDILRALFARHGVASFAATSGEQALELARARRPDLLVLDADLPDVDGVELRSWIRHQDDLSALPVVSYDAGDVADVERERQSVGAVAQILAKGPMTVDEFQWRVMTLLARPHARRR